MRIGPWEFPLGAVLAPMAGFTDAPFRRLCRAFGAELAVSEMVSAAALCHKDKKTAALLYAPEGDAPLAVQLFGHDPDEMAKAVTLVLTGGYEGAVSPPPQIIDINMGCPVRKIVSNGDGSALMRTPDTAARVIEAAVRAAGDTPVTVKIRAGFDEGEKNAVAFSKMAVAAGARAVTVHGRTRAQMYEGRADWGVIAAVRAALPAEIPVVGNGDVRDAESFFQMKAETGCDGVAVGRAALGAPYLFAEICAAVRGEPFTPPSETERRRMAYAMAEAVVRERGEGALRECRGRLSHMLKGMRGAAELRFAVTRAETLSELSALLLHG